MMIALLALLPWSIAASSLFACRMEADGVCRVDGARPDHTDVGMQTLMEGVELHDCRDMCVFDPDCWSALSSVAGGDCTLLGDPIPSGTYVYDEDVDAVWYVQGECPSVCRGGAGGYGGYGDYGGYGAYGEYV